MSIYERYKKLIQDKINSGELTDEFIFQTKERLITYLDKGKITKEQYDELIGMMENGNLG